jgi:hypothetical protein
MYFPTSPVVPAPLARCLGVTRSGMRHTIEPRVKRNPPPGPWPTGGLAFWMWRRLRPAPGSAELRPSGCAPSGASSCRTCPPACAPTAVCHVRRLARYAATAAAMVSLSSRPVPACPEPARIWSASWPAWSGTMPRPGPLPWSAAGPWAWTCGPFPQAGTRPTRATPLSGVASGKLAPGRAWAGWSAYQLVWSAAGPRSSPPAAVRMIQTSSSFSVGINRTYRMFWRFP